MKIDVHTHSHFSHDGHQFIPTLLRQAEKIGIDFIAVTDHVDWDYLYMEGYELLQQINLQKYRLSFNKAAKAFQSVEAVFGAELGFSTFAEPKYLLEFPFSDFDYIINSVHSVNGDDVYFEKYFDGRQKTVAYTSYLKAVLESLNAAYPFCTVAHIGYIKKNAPYQDRSMAYSDYTDLFDEILKRIIAKDKTLEINTNIRGESSMPSYDVLKRYVELGGDNVCFGSDAHRTARIGENYQEIAEIALGLGLKYWTIFRKMQPYRVPISY